MTNANVSRAVPDTVMRNTDHRKQNKRAFTKVASASGKDVAMCFYVEEVNASTRLRDVLISMVLTITICLDDDDNGNCDGSSGSSSSEVDVSQLTLDDGQLCPMELEQALQGDSLLLMACSAGYYQLAQVCLLSSCTGGLVSA